MKKILKNKKEEEKIKNISTGKNDVDGGKSTQSQPQNESKNVELLGKEHISESPQGLSFETCTKKEKTTIQIALPKGACLTVRLGEDLRKPEDGTSPYRVVFKFPAPTENSLDLVAASMAPPSESQASSEAKQRTTNESTEEKAVLPKWTSAESMLGTLDQCQWLLSIKRLITALSLPACRPRVMHAHSSTRHILCLLLSCTQFKTARLKLLKVADLIKLERRQSALARAAVSFDSSRLSLPFPCPCLFFPLFSFSIFLVLLFPVASILYTAVDGGKVSSRAYNTVVLYYCKRPINCPLGRRVWVYERSQSLSCTLFCKLDVCLIALANSSLADPLAIDVINGHVNLAPITSALLWCCRHCAFPAVCLPRKSNKEDRFLLMLNMLSLICISHATFSSLIPTFVQVALPCNVQPPGIDDHVVLILWYKDEEVKRHLCTTYVLTTGNPFPYYTLVWAHFHNWRPSQRYLSVD